ncbi:hypothetical protein [uncultured Croceitalea sp.]|uniref:DUF6252 family protein n=1 Tax=uncultured Croceitalea sp. TaxID=1798908 RepID=UPI003305F588
MKKLLFTILLITTWSCSSSDDSTSETPVGTLLTATVNGQDFAASDELVNATLTLGGIVNIFTVTGAFAESSSGMAKSESIGIVLSFDDETDFTNGTEWSSTNTDTTNRVIGQYIIGAATLSEADAIIASTDANNGSAFLKITSLNTSSQTISGEFNFTAIDEDNGETYQIANGKFNNIGYQLN